MIRRHLSENFSGFYFQSYLIVRALKKRSQQDTKMLLNVSHNIDKLMNGEVQITDLVISKLLRQNIEKYRSLFPHVAAAIRLNVSGVIANRGDNIQYVHT